MLTFFRRIRKRLLGSGQPRKYLLYAVGEISLVVIGILIALQINNWNEGRKAKQSYQLSILALAEDIRNDTINLQRNINTMEKQVVATGTIIPVLESRDRAIKDSLDFIAAFMLLSNVTTVDLNTEVWDDIRTSGMHKTYTDPRLVEIIQSYYSRYKRLANNWENGYRTRIEFREIKYELLLQSDLDRIRANIPEVPSNHAFEAIFKEKRVLTLSKSIGHTSNYFLNRFRDCKNNAEEVLAAIDAEYK